jgi:5'-nucleotidase
MKIEQMMKKYTFFLLLIFCAACSKENQSPKPAGKEDAGEIVVVATNDFHATLDRAEALAQVISDLRNRYGDRMIYLDAGDEFQGSLEGNISKGKAVVGFFNLLQLDAAAIGNHEFDFGPDISNRITVERGEDGMGALKARVSEATYPFLSANLISNPVVSCEPGEKCNALGHKTIFEPRTIIERAGKKICVIGATTATARYRTSPAYLAGATFEDLLPVVQAESKFLHEVAKCDWVLLTVHAGLRYEKDGKTLMPTELLSMVQKMQPPLVDAVIGGDAHNSATEVVHGIPIVQAGYGGRHVGVLHLSHTAGKTVSRFDPLISVPDMGVSFKVTEFLRLYRKEALQKKRETLTTATAPFPLQQNKEMALGNLVAQALLTSAKQKGGAKFALINAGAMRVGLPEGTITYSHLFKFLPFDDSLVVAELTGSELRQLLEIAFSDLSRVPAVGGLRVTLIAPPYSDSVSRDLNGDGIKEEWERNYIKDVREINGAPLNNEKIYKLATLSYLAEGGDNQSYVYNRIPTSRIHWYGELMVREIIADFLKKKPKLNVADYYRENTPNVLTVSAE